MGQFPQDPQDQNPQDFQDPRTGIGSEFCPFKKKVLKLAVTKHEEQPLFFQLFIRDFFSFFTRKKNQVTLTPLHYTTLH